MRTSDACEILEPIRHFLNACGEGAFWVTDPPALNLPAIDDLLRRVIEVHASWYDGRSASFLGVGGVFSRRDVELLLQLQTVAEGWPLIEDGMMDPWERTRQAIRNFEAFTVDVVGERR